MCWRVAVLTENPANSRDIHDVLRSPFEPTLLSIERFRDVDWSEFDGFVIDAWRMAADELEEVTRMLALLSHQGGPVALVIGTQMAAQLLASAPVGPVQTFTRPIASSRIDQSLARVLAGRPKPEAARNGTRNLFLTLPGHGQALVAADEALDRIFALGRRPGALDMPKIDEQSGKIIESLGKSGMGDWISGVRQHHDSTYQHCLLVTGTAVAFGHQLGFRPDDLRRIALGALMHDLGKARIPISILDKPGELTPAERAVIQTHPEVGVELLGDGSGMPDDVHDIILMHHEYLDGTGYPHGNKASDIPDVVRLITIADVFAALIERRAYRPPMSGEDAYSILLKMGGKLDQPIVRAIRPTIFTAPG
jgi:putative nucleotidyltransferase with HDIG domain